PSEGLARRRQAKKDALLGSAWRPDVSRIFSYLLTIAAPCWPPPAPVVHIAPARGRRSVDLAIPPRHAPEAVPLVGERPVSAPPQSRAATASRPARQIE